MANIIVPPSWQLPHRSVTPEHVFYNRRRFLRQLGLASSSALAVSFAACDRSREAEAALHPAASDAGTNRVSAAQPGKGFPAPRNPEFNPKWQLTDERAATTYNNFYEFSFNKDVYRYVGRFTTAPWTVEITGLIEKPMTLDATELAQLFPLEERVYRFRCVEAWSMIVPWSGYPFSKLIEKVVPKPEAKFVRFVTFNRPDQSPGMAQAPRYPWPYHEGLRLDEARNPLTLLVSGVYGKPLPKQNGAPVRLIVPWKYGYKSIKSIVKIEFVAAQPSTFWETLAPDEYPFESNVNPKVPHPRWSQATERVIDTDDRIKTQPFNGYGQYVAKLYPPI